MAAAAVAACIYMSMRQSSHPSIQTALSPCIDPLALPVASWWAGRFSPPPSACSDSRAASCMSGSCGCRAVHKGRVFCDPLVSAGLSTLHPPPFQRAPSQVTGVPRSGATLGAPSCAGGVTCYAALGSAIDVNSCAGSAARLSLSRSSAGHVTLLVHVTPPPPCPEQLAAVKPSTTASHTQGFLRSRLPDSLLPQGWLLPQVLRLPSQSFQDGLPLSYCYWLLHWLLPQGSGHGLGPRCVAVVHGPGEQQAGRKGERLVGICGVHGGQQADRVSV